MAAADESLAGYTYANFDHLVPKRLRWRGVEVPQWHAIQWYMLSPVTQQAFGKSNIAGETGVSMQHNKP
jgi:hypothetical protein